MWLRQTIKWHTSCMHIYYAGATRSPPPRCGHAAAVRARGGGELYVFGGEFAGKSQEKFKHYNDLWVFYFAESRWEKV